MTRTHKTIWVISVVLLVIFIAGFFIHFKKSDTESAWKAAFEWTGISSIPSWATDPKIAIEGSSFSRTFVITFKGSRADIERWVKTEPALKQAQHVKGATEKYILVPQKGSSYGEVIIDQTGLVTIRAVWS